MDDRDPLLAISKVPKGVVGVRYMETEEEVSSFPIDSVIDRLSIGVTFVVTRLCKPAPSDRCV